MLVFQVLSNESPPPTPGASWIVRIKVTVSSRPCGMHTLLASLVHFIASGVRSFYLLGVKGEVTGDM